MHINDDNISKNHIIFVVPHFYKDLKNFKSNIKRERYKVEEPVIMLMPVLLGNYNITKAIFSALCRINYKNYNDSIFKYEYSKLDPISIHNDLYEFENSLTNLFKKYFIHHLNEETQFILKNKEKLF